MLFFQNWTCNRKENKILDEKKFKFENNYQFLIQQKVLQWFYHYHGNLASLLLTDASYLT